MTLVGYPTYWIQRPLLPSGDQVLTRTSVLWLALSLSVLPLIAADDPKLKPIFNGKDLTGWKVPPNNVWFSAKDGILSVKSGPRKNRHRTRSLE